MSQAKDKVQFQLTSEDIQNLETYARKTNRKVPEVVNSMLTDGLEGMMLEVGESVVTLKQLAPWTTSKILDEVGEDGEETETNLKEYRRLREEFGPVTSGVEYHKAFTCGSGFNIKIDNLKDEHQIEMRKIIQDFSNDVFMDDVTVGLDTIVDIMVDEVFTDGVAAAEIVYEGWDENEYEFSDFAEEIHYDTKTIENAEKKKKTLPRYKPKDMAEADWKNLKGITQLKIIDNAYHRLKPYRDARNWQILYYTIDEQANATKEVEPVKLLPWQVLWLSWNRRGNKLKGVSMIKSIAKTSLLLERVMNDLGISMDRWADKKYFFILGDARQGRSWSKEAIRNFLNDMSEMTKKNKTGIPVNAGFDIKEIGGEVYDGGSIIDHMISIICAGMKYPKSFLEPGKSSEGDKAWLAWQVIYGRQQANLKRAIEHQLWEKQLYCKVGTKRTIPKQGVAKTNQPVEKIYVPQLEWSSEGRWYQETKLKILKDWLNVANPITPQLKIAIEVDAAKTLGYSELTFDDVIKQQIIQTKTDTITKEIDLIKKEMELEALQKAKTEKQHLAEPAVLGFVQAPQEEVESSSKDGEDKPEGPKNPELPDQQMTIVKRQNGGVSLRKKPTGSANKRGIAKPPGGTRQPNTANESLEIEEVQEAYIPEPQRVQVDINVKNETLKIETQSNVSIDTKNIDDILTKVVDAEHKLDVKAKLLAEKEAKLNEELTKKEKKQVSGEVDKLIVEIQSLKIDADNANNTITELRGKLSEKKEQEELDIALKKKKLELLNKWKESGD